MKKFLCLLMVPLIVSLCSCRLFQFNSSEQETHEQVETMAEQIVNALTQRDKEGLSNLFCEKIRQTEGFAKQIDAVFDYFIFDIYADYAVSEVYGMRESIEDGQRTQWCVFAPNDYMVYIQVWDDDSDNQGAPRYYGISFDWVITEKTDPALEGLHRFSISLLNYDDAIQVGTTDYFPY